MEDKSNRTASCKSDITVKSMIQQFDKIIASIDRVSDTNVDLSLKLQGIIYKTIKNGGDLKYTAGALQSTFNEYTEQKLVENSSDKASSSLSIYYMDYKKYINNAIMTFDKKYGNIKINEKVFNGTGSIDDFGKTLSTEVLSGVGPDLIVFDPMDFDSINKVLDSGVFDDLNKFITKDSDFKLSDYNIKLMNAGVNNGKRLFLPVYYQLPVFYTTENILKMNNITISDDCIIKELGMIVENFLSNESKKSKYLFDANMNFIYLMKFSEVKFIDYKNKKCNFNSSDFKEVLKLYKSLQPVIAPVAAEEKFGYDLSRLLKNNVVALGIDYMGGLSSIHCYNSLIKHELGENIKLVRMTDSERINTYKPIISAAAAINNNCKIKDEAYNFIKILLSDDIQRILYCDGFSHNAYNINPVSKSAFKKDIEKLSGPEGNKLTFVNEIESISLPAALVGRITGMNMNIAEPEFIDKSVNKIIKSALENYLSGMSNEDETARLINDKVMLFLNE